MYFEVYGSNSDFYWRLKAANHRIIADSGESYSRKADALTAIFRLNSKFTHRCKVKDLTKP